jgi:type IX secretion system substrate protein/endonuclease/exonuclease/phosphatase family protein
MSYNVLRYPLSNPTKADTLKPIIKAVNPDIFLITELTSSTGATTILNDALNVDGVSHYQKATYQNGPDTDNMLFYNSDKLTLKSQYEIPTVLRNISEYVLFVDNGFLTPLSDTIFIHCYMAHLKASNTPADSIQRNQEAVIFKNYLDSKSQPIENIFFGGDFNLYTSEEAAYNTILNGGNILLKDPINTPGEWHNNFNFRSIHTQSTRSSSIGDGGSSGGMDDRFDFIIVGEDVMNGANQITYVPNSYIAYGNDGNHFNKSINGTPTNTAVSSNIADALYYMSDHLPVVMKVYHDGQVSIEEVSNKNDWHGYFYENEFKFKTTKNERTLNFELYDLVGKKIHSKEVSNTKTYNFNLSSFSPGLYFMNVSNGSSQKTYRIVNH